MNIDHLNPPKYDQPPNPSYSDIIASTLKQTLCLILPSRYTTLYAFI
jgi:hypothetical protein